MKVEFYRHQINHEAIDNVQSVLKSLFLTTGPVCSLFEKAFSETTGLTKTVALSSCTAALHLGLLALGVGPGDEVITTPMTFIATVTAILHTGARPVLVDVEPQTGLIDPNAIEAAITPRTKVILPVHLYGCMADMRRLKNIADSYNIDILEDAAHCIEGIRDGVRPGQLSAGACYSFYATKNLTCGEGGAFGTNCKELAAKVRLLRQHGISREATDRYGQSYTHWDMIAYGWKYNLDDIHAAILISQLPELMPRLEIRRNLYRKYISALSALPNIRVPDICGDSALHLFTLQVPPDRRDRILKGMGEDGVGVAVNYRAIHTLTWFCKHLKLKPKDYPVAKRFGDSTLSLPFYPGIKDHELDYVVTVLSKNS